MKKYDLKQILKTAWEISYVAVEKFGGKVKEFFSESLKMAWEQAKNGDVEVEVKLSYDFDHFEAFRVEKTMMKKYGYIISPRKLQQAKKRDEERKEYIRKYFGAIKWDSVEKVFTVKILTSDLIDNLQNKFLACAVKIISIKKVA